MRLLNSSIFYLVLLLAALTAIPYGTVEPWWKAVFECSVFALGLLWIVEGTLSGTWLVRQHRLLIPLVALVGLALFQWKLPVRSVSAVDGGGWRSISFSPYDTQLFIYQLLALIVAAGLLIRYTTTRRRLESLVYLVIGIGLASTIFALARLAFQRTPGFFLPNLSPDLGDGLPGVGYGQFINHNHFAFLAEMALGLLFGLIIGRGLRLKYLLLALAAGTLMSVALIYSGSRGGLIAMVGELLFLAIVFLVIKPSQKLLTDGEGERNRRRRIGQFLVVRSVLLAFLLVVTVIGIVRVGGDPLAEHLQEAQKEEFSNEHDKYANTMRLKIWSTTLSLVKEHPLVGTGFGAYWIAITKYHKGSGEFTPQQAHNDYLELLASGGLIAVGIGLWFVVLFLKASFPGLRTTDPFLGGARFGALAGIFAVAIHSMLDFGLHMTVNAVVFVVLIVIATARIRAPEVVDA